jgi:hypothetical protein
MEERRNSMIINQYGFVIIYMKNQARTRLAKQHIPLLGCHRRLKYAGKCQKESVFSNKLTALPIESNQSPYETITGPPTTNKPNITIHLPGINILSPALFGLL